MKLYILPGACSFVPHTALEWTGADYELEIMDHDALKSDAYLSINPQGTVPALVDGDTVVTQNIAVQTYINALYPDAKIFGANQSPVEKADIMHWLAFLNADLHKGFAPLFAPHKFVEEDTAQEDLQSNAQEKVISMLDIPNTQLGKQEYLTGSKSTADVYLYVVLRWAKKFNLNVEKYQNFNAFISRIEADKGVTAALAQEGLEKV